MQACLINAKILLEFGSVFGYWYLRRWRLPSCVKHATFYPKSQYGEWITDIWRKENVPRAEKKLFYTDKIDLPSSSTVIGLVHLGLLGLKLPEELRLIGLPFKLCLSSGLGVLCPWGLVVLRLKWFCDLWLCSAPNCKQIKYRHERSTTALVLVTLKQTSNQYHRKIEL